MPRPVSSAYVEDKVRLKQEQEERERAQQAQAQPPPPHAYNQQQQMAYSHSYDAADPEQRHHHEYAAQQAAAAAGGFYINPSEYAALQQAQVQVQLQAQQQQQHGYPPHQPPAIGPSSSFGGAPPAAYYPHQQQPGAPMSRSFSGGSSGEMMHPQQQRSVVPEGYPGAYPEHFPPHRHHPPHPHLAHQGQYGPPPQYVGGPPHGPYGAPPLPPGVTASASGGASDHGGSDAGSMTSSHHSSSYHPAQVQGDVMSHAQAANLLVRSYSSSSSQQRPPVPPATRRSNRRGSKGDAASQKQTSAASDGSTSEQQDANKKSNSFKEPDNAVIDTKPAYGDSPLVKHLKKSNAEQRLAEQREQWLKSSAGGDGDGDGDNDDGPPNPPPLQESKSWGPKQSAVPIEMTDQSICCTCKKSKCLKLYCQCFASKAMCGPACRCMMCHNNPSKEKERTEAIRLILQRNPSAFEDKIAKTSGSGKKAGDGAKGHKIGCKCRKSACLKKYCECYHAGVRCGSNCRCTDCKNTPDGSVNNPTSATSMTVSMPNSAYPSQQSRRVEYRGDAWMDVEMMHGQAAPAYGVPVVTTNPADAMAPGTFLASVRKNSSFHQSPPGLQKSGMPKASPGDPRVIKDAALNLAFLKGASPARKEKKMPQNLDISAMPSLTSSEEYAQDESQGQGGAALASGAQQVISPNSERKASNAVDLLLQAAFMNREAGSTASEAPTSAPSSAPSSPPKETKKDVISMPPGGLSDNPETPQRYARQSSQSSIARASPKRKSSFGSDCPTPKRQSSFGSQQEHSPDTRANRKNIRDIETAHSTDAAMLLIGSHSSEGDQACASGGPAVMPPYTPPIPPKTKKTRMGTIKRGDARNVPPDPPTDPAVFDSAARPSKSHSDGEEDGSSRGSPGSNGDSSDNQEDANTDGVFRDRAATPPGKGISSVLTPVSSRIAGLRKLHVNDSTDGGAVTGEAIGMDLQDEINTAKN